MKPFSKLLLAILVLGVSAGFLSAYFLRPKAPALISPLFPSQASPFASILKLSQSTDSGRVLGSSVSPAGSASLTPRNRGLVTELPPTPPKVVSPPSSAANSGSPAPVSISSGDSGNTPKTSSNSNSSSQSSLPAVQDSTELVVAYLKGAQNEDGAPLAKLYGLMSQDFKATFSETEFDSGFLGAQTVVAGAPVANPTIYGNNNDWAEQLITLNLADGSVQKYLAVFHFEDGGWKLYATKEQ